MELWIPITIAAAFMQNLRSALQKHLKGALNTSGATFVRFVFAAPLALLYVLGLAAAGHELPTPHVSFALYAMAGGLAQILATALLVSLFSHRNFAVGTTYSKTETIQTAIFGIVILGESVSSIAVIGILISLVGVMAISTASGEVTAKNLVSGLVSRPALIGIASGAFFGLSAVSIRAASRSLELDDFVMQAAFTLVCVTVFQTVVMAGYMRLRDPGQIMASFRAWRVASLVGLCGMVASSCWFIAMTLENAAYVRAVGQIELVFTFIASYFIFRERASRVEVVGILLIVAGIIVILLGR